MNKKIYKYVNKKIFKILLNTIILVNIIIGMLLLLLLLQTQPAIIEGKKKDEDSIKLRQNDCCFFLRNSRLAPSQSLTVERRASSRP